MNMDQLKQDIVTVGSEGVHTRDLYSRVYGYLKELSTYRASGLTPEQAAELDEAERDGRLVVLPPDGGDDYALCAVLHANGELYDVDAKSVGRPDELVAVLSYLTCVVAKGLDVNYRSLLYAMIQQPSVVEAAEAETALKETAGQERESSIC